MTKISIASIENLAAGKIAADPMKSAWALAFLHKGNGTKENPTAMVALSPGGQIHSADVVIGPYFPLYGSTAEVNLSGIRWSIMPDVKLDRSWIYDQQDPSGSHAWTWDLPSNLRTISAAGQAKTWPIPQGYSPSLDNLPTVKFSADGLPLYGARLESGDSWLVIGNEKRGPFSLLRGFGLCQGGKTLWYVYDDPARPEGPASMVRVGEKSFGPFANIHLDYIRVSDSGSWACVCVEDGKHTVIHDGKKIGTYPKVGRMILSPDGSTLLFTVEEGGKERLTDGKDQGPAYDDILDLDFVAQGKAIWLAAKQQGFSYLMLGDQKLGPFTLLYNLRTAADDQSVEFTVRDRGGDYFPAGGRTFGPYASVSQRDRPEGGFFWICKELEGGKLRLVTPSGLQSEACERYAIGRGGAILLDGLRVGVFCVPADK